jgi:hypothetical protein
LQRAESVKTGYMFIRQNDFAFSNCPGSRLLADCRSVADCNLV